MSDLPQKLFLETLWDYYGKNARDLPWRLPDSHGNFDAYKIMVSEFMLQQTQVSRVVEKYQTFLGVFPDVQALAAAPLREVLAQWSGLGYNRRAKFLHEAAQQICCMHNGTIPETMDELTALPGIGTNTAGAIMAYAFNRPVVFIETNIRTVYIHHFFADDEHVTDQQIVTYLEKTLDHEQPREFYWALMDYGSYLKSKVGNRSRQSAHYYRQSRFEGSARQLRGEVLRQLMVESRTLRQLKTVIQDDRLDAVLNGLKNDGLILQKKHKWQLP